MRENLPSPLSSKEHATVFGGRKVPYNVHGFLVVVGGIHRAVSVALDTGSKIQWKGVAISPVRIGFCVRIKLFFFYVYICPPVCIAEIHVLWKIK